MTAFTRYLGSIDYSGAQTPEASLKGLRVYLAQVLDASRPGRMAARRCLTFGETASASAVIGAGHDVAIGKKADRNG